MSVEMACGKCQGRFLVEAAGTVACPHCGTHVTISPESIPAAAGANVPVDSASPSAADSEVATEKFAGFAELAEAGATEAAAGNGAASPPPVAELVTSAEEDVEAAAAIPDFSSLPDGDDDAEVDEHPSFDYLTAEDVDGDAPTISLPHGMVSDEPPSAMFAEAELPFDDVDGNRETVAAFPDFGEGTDGEEEDDLDAVLGCAGTEATVAEIKTAPVPAPAATVQPVAAPAAEVAAAQPGISRTWFLLLASYASAMTIVCIWLLIQMMTGTHQLENLEDPAQARVRDNKRIVTLYPADAELPRGHVLHLGESRRFGNILVEPIKVTREPLEFVHFSDEQGETKAPTGPVLKLWLKLQNVSDDQTIAPLDSLLLYTNRVQQSDNYELLRGNTFVCRANDKRKEGELLYAYALNTNDVWDLRGQKLDPLGPGEACLTFVPSSTEGIDKLTGKLVWRVHLRKGYSPNKRGVTTLIEVNFDSGQIEGEKT